MAKKKKSGRIRSLLQGLMLKLILMWVFITLVVILPLRWLNPPLTSYQFIDALHNSADPLKVISGRWLNSKEIPAAMKLAVIAAEDQRFPEHFGLDLHALWQAYKHNRQGKHLHGGSTITQQLAKNLYLWPARSYIRKALEAWFSIWMEILWSKPRILEIYLNVVEFGPQVFGIDSAAKNYFHQSGRHLNKRQCALLAAVLPFPKQVNLRHPSPYILQQQHWVFRQMIQLGGRNYLNKLR